MRAARDDTGRRERLTDGVYATGWAVVRKLPEPVAAALGRALADAAWAWRGRGVARLESNLARVVPGASARTLARLSRAGMRSYLRYWMESFRLPAWSAERILGGFALENEHVLTGALARGRGVVVALPHTGNYDLAGAWIALRLGMPFTTVAERLEPEALYERFVAYRTGLGMEVLPHSGHVSGTLARRLRAGGLVCLVADRDLSSSGIEVEFFGSTTRMPAGPATLALRTGAVLLPGTFWYDGPASARGRIHPEIEVPAEGTEAEKAAAMTQALADVFAAGIAEHPQDWHMLQALWPATGAGGRGIPGGRRAHHRSGERKGPVRSAR
ncbi:phosphatidylinositol mannoside acyltransferase [Streptomyces gamaensis]|uniref:Phosphatidylinositol mannoside acyltransferase n=1 Tax=Streptomyces gamaensis TaxID=1763542 RepID=A0ABW0YV02_9ACTN